MAFGNHEIRQLQLTRCGSGAIDDMGKQRTERDVTTVLVRKFLKYLSATFRVSAVIFGDDLDGPTIDAALAVDLFTAASVVRRYQRP